MTDSNKALIGLILFSVACSALAQVLLKLGMDRVHGQADAAGILGQALVSPFVIAGLALYGFGALVWLLVLARADLSFAYPFVGVGFILTLLLGRVVFNESISIERLAGTLLVALGVVLISRGHV